MLVPGQSLSVPHPLHTPPGAPALHVEMPGQSAAVLHCLGVEPPVDEPVPALEEADAADDDDAEREDDAAEDVPLPPVDAAEEAEVLAEEGPDVAGPDDVDAEDDPPFALSSSSVGVEVAQSRASSASRHGSAERSSGDVMHAGIGGGARRCQPGKSGRRISAGNPCSLVDRVVWAPAPCA
jgi:hypothetical protein